MYLYIHLDVHQWLMKRESMNFKERRKGIWEGYDEVKGGGNGVVYQK